MVREYVVFSDDDVIFKKCQGLGMEWKQQDKERYGGSDEGKTWRKNMLLLLMLFSKIAQAMVRKQQDKERCERQRRKTWCEEIFFCC